MDSYHYPHVFLLIYKLLIGKMEQFLTIRFSKDEERTGIIFSPAVSYVRLSVDVLHQKMNFLSLLKDFSKIKNPNLSQQRLGFESGALNGMIILLGAS
jgi:hypothetical protein